MRLSAALFALLWSIVLAASIVVVSAGTPARDSSRAGWIAAETPPWTTIVASDDTGTVARERTDVLRQGLALSGIDRRLAFDLALAANLTLGIFALTVGLTLAGTAPGWSLAAAATFALGMQSLARFGHPPWLPVGGLVLLAIVLVRFARAPSPIGSFVVIACLGLLWSTSALYFHAGAIVVAGWMLAAAPQSRAHGHAGLGLVAAVIALHWADLVFGPNLPPAAKSLAAVPFAHSARAWLGTLGWLELAAFVPFLAAAFSSFLVEGRHRAALVVAGLLLWASLGPHTPALPWIGRPPPLRLFHWPPSGEEFAVPLLLALAAATIVVAVGTRYLSSLAPAGAGFVLALLIAAAPAAALQKGWPEDRGKPIDVTAAPGSPRVLVWPTGFDVLERVALGTPRPQRFVNLEPASLLALAELLPPRPNLLWSESFFAALDALDVTIVAFVEPPPPLPAWGFRPIEDGAGRFAVDLAAAGRRFAALEPIPAEGWKARSSARGDGALPVTNAFDGLRESRWGSGEAQAPGHFFELELAREISGVTRIVLDPGAWESDWPRGLVVEASTDGMSWREIATDPRPAVDARRTVIDFAPETLRSVRLVQRGRDRALDWSIAEISLWREPRS